MIRDLSHQVKKLLLRWEHENILYCHWKSTDHIFEALAGITDLDILVAADDGNKAEQTAINCGFAQMQTSSLRSYPGVHDYISYDSERDLFIHLHLHYQLALGDRWVKAYRIPVESGILSRRVWMEKFSTWTISPADELIIFCGRMCVKYKSPFSSNRIKNEAVYLAELVGDVNYIEQLKDDYDSSLIVLARDVILHSCTSINNKYVKCARSAMSRYRRMSPVTFFLLSKIRLFYRIFIEIYRRKLHNYSFGRRRLSRGGIVVAFIGMDGSGKTSAISRNSSFFAKQMDVKSFFLGSGRSGAPWYRQIVFKLYGTKAKFKDNEKLKNDTPREKRYPLYYLAWVRLVVGDRFRRIRSVFRAKSAGRLVLVDRWPQFSVAGSFDGPKMQEIKNGWFTDKVRLAEEKSILLAKKFPPDIVLRFRVSPQVALSRKPGELTFEQALRAESNLLSIQWPEQCSIFDINADNSVEIVDRQIREAIWSKISGKC